MQTLVNRNGHVSKGKTTETRKGKVSHKRSRRQQAAWLGGLVVGGIIPAITYHVAHYQTETHPMLWLGVAGGLAYSAPMCAEWFARYAGPWKAWGFVVALEVAMTFTPSLWTSLPALATLVGINAMILAKRFAQD